MNIDYQVKNNIGIIAFDQKDSKVNVLNSEILKQFETILDEIRGDTDLEALIIKSNKKDIFIAGADIKEIAGITEPKEGEAKSRAGQEILNKLADLPIPTVAVIDGVALGGGCELALACTYRVATFNEKVNIGLPEVNLGIIPGFAGTYRLPKLVGLSESLKLILAGKPIPNKKALRIGLVDRLFPQTGLENYVLKFVKEIKDSPKRKNKFNKKPKGLQAFLDQTALGRAIVFNQSAKNVKKLTKGFYPAPLKALEVVKKTFSLPRSKALTIEAETFSTLAATDISKNLVNIFYLSEKYKKLSITGCEDIKPEKINKCGVIGAGVMGGGIAQILSYKDITTRLKDINYDAIAKGFQAAHKVFQSAVKRRKLKKAEAQVKMAKITGTVDFSGFQNVDCVIEAVVENMDIKKQVFQEMSDVVPDNCILCTNTSALSVTEMANVTKDPTKVVGFHFFNPVHRMPLVEIIKTDMTSNETIITALGLAKRLSKTPIIVKDAPGFLVNRILLAYINEAGFIFEENGNVTLIDKLMTDFGMPMGPLTLADEVGLDVGTKVLHILHEGLGERFKPVSIFEKIDKEKKLLGKKSGKGFYIHTRNKKRAPNPDINNYRGSSNNIKGTSEDYIDRMVFIMINEAARCLEDGIVDDPSAIDVGMIFGTGFPPFRGGLLRYADHIGINNIVDGLEKFTSTLKANRFKPSQYLLNLNKNKKNFYEL